MRGTVVIGRLAGIPIGINVLWLVIVALITWSLGATYYPDAVSGISPVAAYGLGLLSALLLFASILLHELGHAVVARRRGVRIEGIDLWLLGGVAKLKDSPHTAGDELRYAAAGPAVTFVIALLFGTLAAALGRGAPDALAALVAYQFLVNSLILVFNLMPAFPLDGGRILRAALWRRGGDAGRATRQAVSIGRGFAYGFVALGLLATLEGAVGGLWLALIGFFLLAAGRAEQSGQAVEAVFSGTAAADLASFPAITVSGPTTAAEAVRSSFVPYRYRSFPVVEGDAIRGIVTIDRLESLTPAERERLTVGELAERDPDLFVEDVVDVAELLRRPAFRRVGHAVVTTQDGPPGVISLTDVTRVLRASRLLSGSSGGPYPTVATR